jgi:hypothetical protein
MIREDECIGVNPTVHLTATTYCPLNLNLKHLKSVRTASWYLAKYYMISENTS